MVGLSTVGAADDGAFRSPSLPLRPTSFGPAFPRRDVLPNPGANTTWDTGTPANSTLASDPSVDRDAKAAVTLANPGLAAEEVGLGALALALALALGTAEAGPVAAP